MSVTARGGYQIVDFQDIAIPPEGGDTVKIPGIYEMAVNCQRKPVLLCNCKIFIQGNDFPMPMQYVVAQTFGGPTDPVFISVIGDSPVSITVNPNDKVTYYVNA